MGKFSTAASQEPFGAVDMSYYSSGTNSSSHLTLTEMVERTFARAEKLLATPEDDDYPACLAPLNRDLLRFAENLPRAVAAQQEKDLRYALPSEDVSSVPRRKKITEQEVRALPGFAALRAARILGSRTLRMKLTEFVYLGEREGETDIVIAVRW